MHNKMMKLSRLLAAVSLLLIVIVPGQAQNFLGDARWIAMGGVSGSQKNMALSLARGSFPGERSYRSFPVPLGLIQVLRNPKIFDPGDPEFNPVQAMEYAANPLHLMADRDGDDKGEQLVTDLVNGRISRDLNAYRGFTPKSDIKAQGLIDSGWGKTIRFSDDNSGLLHGVYIGAGPYISIGTEVTFDQNLLNILGSNTNTYLPNSTFTIADTTHDQFAGAITGGYRVRVPVSGLSSAGSDQDGLYLGINYNHLQGFHYDTFDLDVRFDTDANGLITFRPGSVPIGVSRVTSSDGRGFSIDLASGLIVNRWVFGIAAHGVANRIDWSELRSERYELATLVNGRNFVKTTLPVPSSESRVTLPIRYTGSVAYQSNRWTAVSRVTHGLQDWELHGGIEYSLGLIDVRTGGRYSRDLWHPSAGLGINFGERFGIDGAVYTTAANIEQKRRPGFALSVRF